MKRNGKKGQRPIDRVHHVQAEGHPVDAAINLRLPQLALRERIQRATKRLQAALGSRRDLWLQLEEPLNELHGDREDAYFDLGYEHGYAAGRMRARKMAPAGRELAVRMRDHAIQHAPGRESAAAALIEAALALVVAAVPPKVKTRK